MSASRSSTKADSAAVASDAGRVIHERTNADAAAGVAMRRIPNGWAASTCQVYLAVDAERVAEHALHDPVGPPGREAEQERAAERVARSG